MLEIIATLLLETSLHLFDIRCTDTAFQFSDLVFKQFDVSMSQIPDRVPCFSQFALPKDKQSADGQRIYINHRPLNSDWFEAIQKSDCGRLWPHRLEVQSGLTIQ